MASPPPATQVAPIRPPKSAWDELDGSPRNHVTRFHRMAPTSPAKMTTGLISASSTSPPEMVLATWTDRKAPVRLRTAAIATAVLGRKAPVAIDVAMALAVSWNPLVKSKASAVTTTTTMMMSDPSMSRAPSNGRPELCRPRWLLRYWVCACLGDQGARRGFVEAPPTGNPAAWGRATERPMPNVHRWSRRRRHAGQRAGLRGLQLPPAGV